MKFIGYINGAPVYEDPEAPAGMLYFLSQDWHQRTRMIPLTRWERFLVTLKRMFKNGRL